MRADKRTILLLVSLAASVLLCYYAKLRYEGPGAALMRESGAAVFYEIFWCVLAALLLPRARPIAIALWVLAATCALEFLQLWHPPFLEWLRSFFLGRAILGSSFDWNDFPYYFLGSALGGVLISVLPGGKRPRSV